MDEDTGTTAFDTSGNSFDGTLVNGPVWLPAGGVDDGALSFDGVDDYVEVPWDNALHPTHSITVSLWMRPDTWTGHNNAMLLGHASDGPYRLRLPNGNELVWYVDQLWDNTSVTCPAPTPGEWHHAVGVYDGQSIKLYLDGVLQQEKLAQSDMKRDWIVANRIGSRDTNADTSFALKSPSVADLHALVAIAYKGKLAGLNTTMDSTNDYYYLTMRYE